MTVSPIFMSVTGESKYNLEIYQHRHSHLLKPNACLTQSQQHGNAMKKQDLGFHHHSNKMAFAMKGKKLVKILPPQTGKRQSLSKWLISKYLCYGMQYYLWASTCHKCSIVNKMVSISGKYSTCYLIRSIAMAFTWLELWCSPIAMTQ